MPELKVTHGGKVHAVAVDRVYRIKRGDEEQALKTMRADGADNIVFKGDHGELYIAARIGIPKQIEINDRIEISPSSRVEFNGVRGTLMGFDEERNTTLETAKSRAGWFAATGAGVGVAGLAVAMLKFGVAVSPVVAVGAIGGLALLGFVGGFFGRKKPNFDLLDRHAGGMELAAPRPPVRVPTSSGAIDI